MADLLGTLKRHRLGLFVVLVGLLLAFMLWSVKGALAAFIIGVALAFVLDPLVTFLQRRGVPRWGGVLIAYAVVVGLVAAIVAYAIPPIAAQARDLISHMPQLSAALSDWQQALIDWYESLPLPPELRDARILRMEIPYGRFERRIELPPVPFQISGRHLANGCLMLRLQKGQR